jgi:hypothetical protein
MQAGKIFRILSCLVIVCGICLFAPGWMGAAEVGGGTQVIEPRMVHVRNDGAREWSSFAERPEAAALEVRLRAEKNSQEYSLRLRQQDVKQAWRVLLNGKSLGALVRDENDMVVYFPIAAMALADGENVLRIESTARGAASADDIRVGDIRIEPRSVSEALGEVTLELSVSDADSHMPLPARFTIVDANGSLQSTANISNDHLAVRPGVVYTSDGRARVGLPAGQYTVYAGRGFEYSLAKSDVTLISGMAASRMLTIRREVPTPGYVACDTHVHTLTYSGHGDASISERMITLAGEGIELPIATDHNVHIDYQQHAERLGVRPYFTPVIGNEVTTTVGHFNVFPIEAGSRVPDFKLKEWRAIFEEIFGTPGVKVAILNHARDLHSGTRPFGPQLFNAAVGERLDGWPMRFNAMEVVNSAAIQTDPLRLIHDWMALLNRGHQVTPVGSSDSHDVARHFVGQGRTYIRCDDTDAGNLNVDAAVRSFIAGQVKVSYGLITEMVVAGKYQSGDLATVSGIDVDVGVRVLAPHWIEASRVKLYANGQLVREEAIGTSSGTKEPGVKWHGTWKFTPPKHDVYLVAVALGPGVTGPYWPTAKPYQPTSPDWEPCVLGVSGAIWLDGDGDGRRSSARDYAERAFAASGGELPKLIAALGGYDAATAAQAAHLARVAGVSLDSEEAMKAIKGAAKQVQAGFQSYLDAWRENQRARVP